MPNIVRSQPLRLGAGIKRIHVVGQEIAKNKRDGTDNPVFTVKHKGRTYWCRAWTAEGAVVGVQNFSKRLASGAVAWLETRAPVTLHPLT